MTRSLDEEIRHDADRLLASGLLALLARHGDVHVVGSYALRTMTWRDLDIHLVKDHGDVNAFFAMGAELAELLQPHRMHFRDETITGMPGLPKGFYWGIYRGDERAGAWKIDVWQTNREGFDSVRRFSDDISTRLNNENRRIIVDIKTACWRHPQYRRGFTSADVYSAVLDRGIRDVDTFWIDLRETKGIVKAVE